jgi:cytochrome c
MNMTKTAASLLLTLFITSCGGKQEGADSEPVDETPEASADSGAPKPVDDIAQGKVLVEGSDCKTCHQEKIKLVGPAHYDVAVKYEFTDANVKLLASKIISGGSGVWGEIPMAPHANISQADAEKMAKYVLSLDGEQAK